MKILLSCVVTLLFPVVSTKAQKPPAIPAGVPITLSVFSESISLPTLKRIQAGGLGIKVGTEFYYRNRPGSQLIQTLHIGYYHHPRVQSGLFATTEFGFRKYAGPFWIDALVGGGALLIRPAMPFYERNEGTGEYRKAATFQLKFMPTVNLGIGYQLPNRTTLFTRYEVFGEVPFRALILPHQALHLGTRFLLK
ncbi:hypothetical protein GCM10027347_18190 [Larkinella harenae]